MRVGLACACAVALAACGNTVDSLGYNDSESKVLHPLGKLASYPNPFRDLLGQTDAAIAAKTEAAFAQLFHGTSAQVIYVEVGTDQAYIEDVLHDNEVRTEGMGLGMMVAVELDKIDEFNRLWTYAKSTLEVTGGPNQGYFNSFCDSADGSSSAPCLDPFGFEQFVMALLLANDRWGSAGAINYGADALALFHTMRHKEDDSGGIVDGVTDTFDATTSLVLDIPNVSAAGETRPSLEMPGYLGLWAQATADSFWTGAASNGRTFWQSAANTTTGFTPVRAMFDGTPLANWNIFAPEAYRVQINVVIDQIWSGNAPWNVSESNALLNFFSSQGINSYGTTYSLDGTSVLNPAREPSLVVANGISALASTNGDRSDYVSAVWNLGVPTGSSRYYAGILDLVGLLILGGQFQVW
jgi:oligosaccharide reducing-end xylanase